MGLMKKLAKKAAALIGVAAIAATSAAPTFGAAEYQKAKGPADVPFEKYLVMDKNAEVPNAKFGFEVTAGEATQYESDESVIEIFPGPDADKVTMTGVGSGAEDFEIAFAPGDETASAENEMVKNYDPSTQKYALKTGSLDFSACEYSEPGAYRYVLTESGTNQGIENDAQASRVIDVYVVDDSDDSATKLKVESVILHSGADSLNSEKSQGFTNVYSTNNLTFRKEVEGSKASRDKWFEFTLDIEGAAKGTKYAVNLSGAAAASGANDATIEANSNKTNPTEIVVGEDGKAQAKFYLQHGQEITVLGLADGTSYSVTENKENYEQTPKGVKGYEDEVSGTMSGASVKTSYLNSKKGIIETGVNEKNAPYAAVGIFGIIGAAAVLIMRRRRKA